jgi:predicted transglutaminase-like cysteine proteinase
VDLDRLKQQCWNGIPSQHRATCWQLLLVRFIHSRSLHAGSHSFQGYMPTGRDRRASTIQDKRQQYWDTVRQLWHGVDLHDLPEYERETLSQINKDVNRTLR